MLKLPQPCQLCGQITREPLCPDCQYSLPDTPCRCLRCALPLQQAGLICGECLSQPPAFSRILCACDHSRPASDWLNRFKQHADLSAGELLIGQLLTRVRQSYDTLACPLPDYLIPVPMHWRAQLRRGFNQAGWISARLSRQLGIPCLPALHRSQPGPPQKTLNRRQRLRSLRNHYHINPDCLTHLSQRHVALVDDVVTTGASARLLSQLLRQHGAEQVEVWCLTRTPKHQ